jgi:hypothetical protein
VGEIEIGEVGTLEENGRDDLGVVRAVATSGNDENVELGASREVDHSVVVRAVGRREIIEAERQVDDVREDEEQGREDLAAALCYLAADKTRRPLRESNGMDEVTSARGDGVEEEM